MEVGEKLIISWLTSSVSSELKFSGTEIHTVSFTFLNGWTVKKTVLLLAIKLINWKHYLSWKVN